MTLAVCLWGHPAPPPGFTVPRKSRPVCATLCRKCAGVRILVAEDETIIRLDLRALLEQAGFEVCGEARDGVEAVELARELEPDLAVMDVKMPRLDGIDAARRILEERPIPIVMVTAYGQDEIVSRAVEAGVYGYLVKPFREQDLLPGDPHGPRASRRAAGAARGGRVAGGRVGGAQGDRAREGRAHGEGRPDGARGVRATAPCEPALGQTAEGRGGGPDRDVRVGLRTHDGHGEPGRAELGRLGFVAGARQQLHPQPRPAHPLA